MTASVAEFKKCAMCKLLHPVSEFSPDVRMKSGLNSYCHDCRRLNARRRRASDPEHARAISRAASKRRRTPERSRASQLKFRYGLSVEDYTALLESQNSCCAVCSTPQPGGMGSWHVDHCHDTGRIRGLLCSTCNVGIGMFKDSPDLLAAAVAYLSRGLA